jgi:NAD(P)-dependent dehydrogenase (short-subunit alcohol dehydrogenase family)
VLVDGKVAVIAGVGPGLGRDTALAMARHGADVVLSARTTETSEQVAQEVRDLGRRALVVPCDITDPVACDALAAATIAEHGHLDVLVVNAFREGPHRTVEAADLDDWRTTMEVNFFGSLHLVRSAVPHLRNVDAGRIVLVNTMSVHQAQDRFGGYAASKAALAMICKTLALELGKDGIRVNGVFPGYIWAYAVEMYFAHKASLRGVDPQVVYDEIAAETALGYIPTSEEVAGTIVFFASELSRACTGVALPVNAGHVFL